MSTIREFVLRSNAPYHAFNVSQHKSSAHDSKRRKKTMTNAKLLNGQKKECNDYFSKTYNKTCFKKKDKKSESYFASVENLLNFSVP